PFLAGVQRCRRAFALEHLPKTEAQLVDGIEEVRVRVTGFRREEFEDSEERLTVTDGKGERRPESQVPCQGGAWKVRILGHIDDPGRRIGFPDSPWEPHAFLEARLEAPISEGRAFKVGMKQ